MKFFSYAAFALTALFLGVGPAVSANTQSKSVEAYEAFLESMQEEIEAEVDRQFEAEEQELELLSDPLELGKRVTVRYVRGPRQLQVTGTFRDLSINSNPPYVQIGDQRVYFNDVIEIDRKRLYWGSLPQAQRGPLKVEIERRRQQLEERKERVRRVKRNTALERAGYTREFFDQTIKLNGQFQPKRELGDETMDLIVEVSEVSPLAKAAIINRTNHDSVITVYLDGTPISSNLPNEFGVEFPTLEWNSHVFWVFKEHLGVGGDTSTGQVAANISRDFRFHVMRKGAGSWWLKPAASPTARPRPQSTSRVTCPECYGAKVVPSNTAAPAGAADQAMPEIATSGSKNDESFVVPGAASAEKTLDEQLDEVGAALEPDNASAEANMMACPRCMGQGTITRDTTHQVTTYSFRLELIEQNLADYSAALAGKYSRVSQNSAEYQQQVDAYVEKVQAEARADRLANAAEIRQREAERRRREEEARRMREKMDSVMQKYLWMTAAEAKMEGIPRAIDSYRSVYVFDDPNFPSTMRTGDTSIEIQKFTDWNNSPTPLNVNNRDKGVRLYGLRYRLLQGEVKGDPHFYVQYMVDADTTSAREMVLINLETSYKINNQDEDVTASGTYRLPPVKLFQVLGTVQIDSRAVAEGISDMSVDYTFPQ